MELVLVAVIVAVFVLAFGRAHRNAHRTVDEVRHRTEDLNPSLEADRGRGDHDRRH